MSCKCCVLSYLQTEGGGQAAMADCKSCIYKRLMILSRKRPGRISASSYFDEKIFCIDGRVAPSIITEANPASRRCA